MNLYIDTNVLFALADSRDGRHREAVRVLAGLQAQRHLLTLGWHTAIEFADGVSESKGQASASHFLEALLASPRFRVVSSEAAAAQAREVFSERPNWKVDFSDCLSFAVMRAHGIRTAFTFDSDFKKAGFETVP